METIAERLDHRAIDLRCNAPTDNPPSLQYSKDATRPDGSRSGSGAGERLDRAQRRTVTTSCGADTPDGADGGLRYLEHYEFGLVREALAERETLWRIAPHVIHPLRFVLPHRAGLRPRWLLRTGLFLYDHLGGRRLLPPSRSINLDRHLAGGPLKPDFHHGWEYSDGWVDDSRLVVLNARDAADRGASILPHHELTCAVRKDGLWHLSARCYGSEATFASRAIVNAAGPAVLDVQALGSVRGRDSLRLVRGSHIVVPRLFDHGYAYFFQPPDKRIFFALPYERDFTLIGTTDREHRIGVDPIAASVDEIDYLCRGANDYFRARISPSDVVWSFAGVRPLVDRGDGRPEAASRGYRFEVDALAGATPMLTVFGGKITTYRRLAEEALDRLAPHLGSLSAKHWTSTQPLPGGNFDVLGRQALADSLLTAYPFRDPYEALRIISAYGTLAVEWLGNSRDRDALGRDFGGGLSQAEVEYSMDRERARTPEDILWRRTKLGLRFDASGIATLRDHMQSRLGR